MKAKRNKNNLPGHDLAEVLNIWSDDGETELYAGDGRKIEGDEKKEILAKMREILMMSPVHTCRIVSMERYKNKKNK